MKLKYYLRGVGVGIIITTLIMTIALAASKNNSKVQMTDAEIEARAIEMGYVLADKADDKVKPAETSDELEIKEPETKATESKAVEKEETVEKAQETTKSQDIVVEYFSFSIAGGQSSNTVAQNLYEAGAVDDAKKFSDYMDSIDVDNRIQAGTFYVTKNMDYDDLVAILVTKQADRDTTPPKNGKLVE